MKKSPLTNPNTLTNPLTLMIRVPGNEGLDGTYLNTVKAIYEPTTANITLNG